MAHQFTIWIPHHANAPHAAQGTKMGLCYMPAHHCFLFPELLPRRSCLSGGCCSATPFASALAMLEIEGEVAPPAPASRAEGSTPGSPHKGDAANRKGTPLALDDSNTICQRLAFTFPWSPEAGVHLALAMRRRALLGPCMDKPCRAPGSSKDPARITLLAGPTTNGQPPAPPTTAHRKFMLRVSETGLPLPPPVPCTAQRQALVCALVLSQHSW